MRSPFFPDRGPCPNRHKIELELDGFETRRQAADESTIRQQHLMASGNERGIGLADLLKSCTATDPCMSAACPPCFRVFRKWFFHQASELYDEYSNAHILTVVLYHRALTSADLTPDELVRINGAFRTALRRAGFQGPLIGSLEIDYHSDIGQWQPHYHLLEFGEKAAVKRLRRHLNVACREFSEKYERKCRPVHRAPVRDPARQLSYLFKGYAARIDSYQAITGQRRTKKFRLHPSELELALQTVHKLGFTGLLFLYGLRRNGSDISITAVTDK